MSTTDDNGVEIVGGHWAQIPEALLFDPTISASAIRVYGILMRYGSTPGSCYPSRATIAEHMGASERSVSPWLTELETGGWMDRVPRFRPDGGQTSNGYRLYLVPRSSVGAPTPGKAPRPSSHEVPPPTPTSDAKESQVEREPVEREGSYARGQQTLVGVTAPAAVALTPELIDDAFVQFWRLYPRRTGKGEARAAFRKAVARVGLGPVLAGAERYAADPNHPEDRTKIPLPATWLNGGRWDDDPLPVRGGPTPPPSRTGQAFANMREIAARAAAAQSEVNALGFGAPAVGR